MRRYTNLKFDVGRTLGPSVCTNIARRVCIIFVICSLKSKSIKIQFNRVHLGRDGLSTAQIAFATVTNKGQSQTDTSVFIPCCQIHNETSMRLLFNDQNGWK